MTCPNKEILETESSLVVTRGVREVMAKRYKVSEMKNVPKLIAGMVAYIYEYTKNHWTVGYECVNCMVC